MEKNQKKKNKCSVCGKELKSDKETFIYFDPSNRAITKSMSNVYFCKECMEKR